MSTSDSYEQRFDEDVQQNEHNTCPECAGRVTTNVRETVCDDCGLVIEAEPIDHGPEWRLFEDDDDSPERTGAPLTPNRHDRGLSTEIGRGADAKGKQLSQRRQRRMRRLRREQGRAVRGTTADQNRMRGIYEIRRITSRLDLGESVRDQACQLFRAAQSADLLPGRSIEAMAGACVYAVCRCNQRPVTEGDIRRYTRESGTSVTAAYKTLNAGLDLPTPPRRPREFIPKFVSELDPPTATNIERRARELAKLAAETERSVGQNPRGVAAACIYHATQEIDVMLTQECIAETAEVTAMTLRKQWRMIQALSQTR
jgi:transcription initiation factor TFIIB